MWPRPDGASRDGAGDDISTDELVKDDLYPAYDIPVISTATGDPSGRSGVSGWLGVRLHRV
jgi:hypothetical protein